MKTLKYWFTQYIARRLNTEMGCEDFNIARERTVAHAQGVVLEIGFGSGYNLPFYKNITELYALEPSWSLYKYAEDRIAKVSFPVTHIPHGAEHIPLPDQSVDTIVSTWTLCSVSNIYSSLKEMRRVLKPTGKFYFIEHGISTQPFFKVTQKIITPISRHFTGNCHMDRNIEKELHNAGFTIIEIKKEQEKNRPLMFSYSGIAVVQGDV